MLLFFVFVLGSVLIAIGPYRRLYLWASILSTRPVSMLPYLRTYLTHIDRELVTLTEHPPAPVRTRFVDLIKGLYNAIPSEVPPIPDRNQEEDPYDSYFSEIKLFTRPHTNRPSNYYAFAHVVRRIYETLARAIPKVYQGTPLGTIRLIDLIDIREVISIVRGHFFSDYVEQSGLFEGVRHRLNIDRLDISERELPARLLQLKKPERLDPRDFDPKAPPEKVIDTYLRNTPLTKLFSPEVGIPYCLEYLPRFEHMQIIGTQGHGKTQALHRLLFNDLNDPKKPGIIIVDPHGSVTDTITSLRRFANTDELILVDPADHPALGLFDVRLSSANEEAFNLVIGDIVHFCRTLLEADLSSTMNLVLHPLVQLMVHHKGATLTTLADAIESLSPFGEALTRLPAESQKYLREQLPRLGNQTKQAVTNRILGIPMLSPTFNHMFNATENRVDIDDVINSGKVLVVDTRGLPHNLANVLGRHFIFQTFRAAMRRKVHGTNRPAFLYIDEAWRMFDGTIEQIIFETRKFGLGLVIAHHTVAQLQSLQSALDLCAYRLVAGEGATSLARQMKTTPEAIADMKMADRLWSEWALLDRHRKLTKTLRIASGAFDKEPRMSAEEYNDFRDRNRARLQMQKPAPEQMPAIPTPSTEAQWQGVE